MYFYCYDADAIITDDDVRTEYNDAVKRGEYDGTFEDYLEGCMYYNNGDLCTLSHHYNAVADRLRRTDEDDTDEREALTEYLNNLEKLMQEGRENHVIPRI